MNRNLLLGYFKAQTEFEEERSKGADMDVEVSAVWDKEKNNITVTPRVTFCVNRDEAPLWLCLCADGRWYVKS